MEISDDLALMYIFGINIRVTKRLFDVISTTIITIISLPLQAVLYLLIRISDPGPAIYKHECYGREGKKIFVYKFRTMYAKYSLGEKFGGRKIDDVLKQLPSEKAEEFKKTAKIKNDPRVSKLGKFLRRTSLDELPQLWSVIRGDMSFVGPRPALFNQVDLIDMRTTVGVHCLTPGITGWAQINGRDEISIQEKVKLETYYLNNKSLIFDVKIIFQTFY